MTRRWTRLLVALFLLAALLSVAVVLWGEWGRLGGLLGEVRSFRWRLEPLSLAGATLVAVANLLGMAGIWVRLVRSSGEEVSYPAGVRVWTVTNLGRYIPGKVWQLSGLAVYMRRRGRSGARALLAALSFQVLNLATGVAVALAILGARALGPVREGALSLDPWRVGAGLLVLLVLLHPAVIRALTRLAARVMREEMRPGESVTARALSEGGAGMLIAWGAYGVSFWLFVRGVAGPGQGSFAVLLAAFAAAYVAGFLVLVAPGGLVVREGALTALLAALTPLPAAVAAAVAVGYRVCLTVSELLALGVVFLLPRSGLPAGIGADVGGEG